MFTRPLAIIKFVVSHWKLSLFLAFIYIIVKYVVFVNA